jgi:hypothetical protein
MALKSTSKYETWRAKWSNFTSYSGSSLVSKDELLTSISNNKGGNNPFHARHITLSGSYGYCWNGATKGKRFTEGGPSSFGAGVSISAPDPEWDPAAIWSRTNPSRPVTRLPVFWLELREVPDMIRQAGRFLLDAKNWRRYVRSAHQTRDLATANLAFQFGWAPLISDLWRIASFQDAVDKRRKLMDRLYSGKGLRRTGRLGQTSVSDVKSSYAVNFGNYKNFYVTYQRSSTAESWFVVYWKPNSYNPLPPSDAVLRQYLTGLHPSHILSNVWEALPWSWLIDYFTNIGDVLEAGNHHLAVPQGGCVMTKVTRISKHPELISGNDKVTPGTLKIIDHRRSPMGSVGLNARLPTLEAGQLSILGSLAVLKGRKTLGT